MLTAAAFPLKAWHAKIVQATSIEVVTSGLHRVVMSHIELTYAVTLPWHRVASMTVTCKAYAVGTVSIASKTDIIA